MELALYMNYSSHVLIFAEDLNQFPLRKGRKIFGSTLRIFSCEHFCEDVYLHSARLNQLSGMKKMSYVSDCPSICD